MRKDWGGQSTPSFFVFIREAWYIRWKNTHVIFESNNELKVGELFKMPNMNNIDPKKWLVTFGKLIAYTTRDIVVDKLPNATSILSEVGSSVSEAKDSVANAIR